MECTEKTVFVVKLGVFIDTNYFHAGCLCNGTWGPKIYVLVSVFKTVITGGSLSKFDLTAQCQFDGESLSKFDI